MNIGARVYGHRSPTSNGAATKQAIQRHRVTLVKGLELVSTDAKT